MRRTTIMLPLGLKRRAEDYARRRGLSVGEVIRRSLERTIEEPSHAETDPLFADVSLYRGRTPADYSESHDRYLYDQDTE